jgi:beta-fructofuranosidase
MNALSEMVRVRANLNPRSILHLWIKAIRPSVPARVTVEIESGHKYMTAASSETVEFEFVELRPGLDESVHLAWRSDETVVSYAYAFDPETVLKSGISILYIADETRTPALPESYHFRPPLGWMNDPNGFCKVGDTFHLFYQHYPHAQVWSAMHWGHATSTNLIDWTHQPIALRPDPLIGQRYEGKGGMLSGSAVPLHDGKGLRLFFTESRPDRVLARELQQTAIVPDGISAMGAETIIASSPSGIGLGSDFRDPYVFLGPDGKLRMLVGSSDKDGGVILLFQSNDPTGASGWFFQSVIHRDNRQGTRCAECACMVPLDGPPESPDTFWALIYGQLKKVEYADGPRHPTIAVVGHFDGHHFSPLFERDLDFASGAYGFQAFAGEDGVLAIAWLADWSDWDTKSKFPTSMTLPRRLVLSADKTSLLTPPIGATALLRKGSLDGDRLRNGKWVSLANGAAEIAITLSQADGPLVLEFEHPETNVSVVVGQAEIELAVEALGQIHRRKVATGAQPRLVHVFIDRGSIELFADGGRWTATKRLESTAPFACMRVGAGRDAVAEVNGWNLASGPTP